MWRVVIHSSPISPARSFPSVLLVCSTARSGASTQLGRRGGSPIGLGVGARNEFRTRGRSIVDSVKLTGTGSYSYWAYAGRCGGEPRLRQDRRRLGAPTVGGSLDLAPRHVSAFPPGKPGTVARASGWDPHRQIRRAVSWRSAHRSVGGREGRQPTLTVALRGIACPTPIPTQPIDERHG